MSPRNESGYDPVGDPRTGRPPLPDERERQRHAQPDEMHPDDFAQPRQSFTSGEQGGYTEESSIADSSMMDKLVADDTDVAQSLKEAGEVVSSQVSAAASSAMERGSELASTASDRMQRFAGDLIAFTRRKPLIALLGVAIAGMLIGMIRRNRS